jgi:UDP-hydrolysing UDP-N-acetyl-D-glucosamine 2-epimerase
LSRCVEGYARLLEHQNAAIIIGDRFEALGAACAAVQMRVPIIHFQGGEDSGIADDQHRWAITGMATYHVPATEDARQRLLACGIHEDSILTVGCPAGDTCREIRQEVSANNLTVIQYHPCEDDQPSMFEDTLTAVMDTGREFVCFWPNIDAGAERIMKTIRKRLNREPRTVKNLLPKDYYKLIGGADLLVGNSSAFCRDSAFFGTPTVLVGKRQRDRLAGAHVVHAPGCEDIEHAIQTATLRGRTEPSTLFGDGHVSERFCEVLPKMPMVARRWKSGDILTKTAHSVGCA